MFWWSLGFWVVGDGHGLVMAAFSAFGAKEMHCGRRATQRRPLLQTASNTCRRVFKGSQGHICVINTLGTMLLWFGEERSSGMMVMTPRSPRCFSPLSQSSQRPRPAAGVTWRAAPLERATTDGPRGRMGDLPTAARGTYLCSSASRGPADSVTTSQATPAGATPSGGAAAAPPQNLGEAAASEGGHATLAPPEGGIT